MTMSWLKVSFGWDEITVTSETSHCVTQGCNSFFEWVNIKIKNTHKTSDTASVEHFSYSLRVEWLMNKRT